MHVIHLKVEMNDDLTLHAPIPPVLPPQTQIMLEDWKLLPLWLVHSASLMMGISVPCRAMGKEQDPVGIQQWIVHYLLPVFNI
jgi:hypothetical protein